MAGAPENRPERRAREEQRTDEEQQDAEKGRAGGADRHADGAAEKLPQVAALIPAESDHQPEREDEEARAEGPHLDEGAPGDHQAAEADEGDRHEPGGAADEGIEPVGHRAADIAAVPARVDDAAEEEPEREQPEPPELRMLQPPRPRGLGRALLDPRGSLGTQLALALLARHV